MQPTHHQPDADLDARLVEALDASTQLDFELSRERSRYGAAFDLDDAIAAEVSASRPRRRPVRSRRSAIAIVGGLAAAVLVAGALAPGAKHDAGTHASAPFVARDASAAEVLRQAAERMLAADGDIAGSGPAWHSIATDKAGGAYESWFDSTAGTARWVMYQPEVKDAPTGLGTAINQRLPATYYVLDVDAKGNGTIRQYHDGPDGWKPESGGMQMNGSVNGPDSIFISSIETEALIWLRAVDAADDPSELRAANARFVEKTHMWFAPPTEDPTLGGDKEAARAMQLLYLLRLARLEPAAVAQLYQDVIDVDQLERLDDGTVDGRDVVRLRLFSPPKGPGGETLASVLLLDMETGMPVGIESVNGSTRELFEAPRRTASVGNDPISCGHDEQPPCELLRGEGPIAAAADRIAARSSQPLDVTPGTAQDDQGPTAVAAAPVAGDGGADVVAENPAPGSAPSATNAVSVAPTDGEIH